MITRSFWWMATFYFNYIQVYVFLMWWRLKLRRCRLCYKKSAQSSPIGNQMAYASLRQGGVGSSREANSLKGSSSSIESLGREILEMRLKDAKRELDEDRVKFYFELLVLSGTCLLLNECLLCWKHWTTMAYAFGGCRFVSHTTKGVPKFKSFQILSLTQFLPFVSNQWVWLVVKTRPYWCRIIKYSKRCSLTAQACKISKNTIVCFRTSFNN